MTFPKSFPSEPSEALPLDVLPCSNCEFIPAEPTREQRAIMCVAEEECDKAARRLGLSRRRFLRTGAATAICLIAIDKVMGADAGGYVFGQTLPISRAGNCNLEFPNAQLSHGPGEFIFDIQTHHVEPSGAWRNTGLDKFYAMLFPQSRCGESDPMECLSRRHFIKELYLDSSTDVCVLSAVPALPGTNPVSTNDAARTVAMVNEMAKSQRCIMHAFVMPNYGISSGGGEPKYMKRELEAMEQAAQHHKGILRAWKVYTPQGDVPGAGGWWLDDKVGNAFLEQVRLVSDKYGVPKIVCTHKGFAFPGFDQEKAATRDVGVAAKAHPDITFIVYHSGFDVPADGAGLGQSRGPYPEGAGEDGISSSERGVLNFIKALRENGHDATRFIAPGLSHGNIPNVYAELGSVWSAFVSMSVDDRTYLLCNLIRYIGPKRVLWGTDSLWYGSPQPFIVAMRNFQMNPKIASSPLYKLPYGLDGDIDDPTRNALSAASYMTSNPAVTGWPSDKVAHPERSIRNAILGRNAAVPYGIDPSAKLRALSCDQLETVREEYRAEPFCDQNRTL
jgi:predicted TIM-barrel fold metal-dependent hydrolase